MTSADDGSNSIGRDERRPSLFLLLLSADNSRKKAKVEVCTYRVFDEYFGLGSKHERSDAHDEFELVGGLLLVFRWWSVEDRGIWTGRHSQGNALEGTAKEMHWNY
eukprot:scaffold5088_cov98-Cylindrotheca_fusiformis.AAC.14